MWFRPCFWVIVWNTENWLFCLLEAKPRRALWMEGTYISSQRPATPPPIRTQEEPFVIVLILCWLRYDRKEGSKAGWGKKGVPCPRQALHPPLAFGLPAPATAYEAQLRSKFSPTNPHRTDKCLQRSLRRNHKHKRPWEGKASVHGTSSASGQAHSNSWRKVDHLAKTKRITSFLKDTPRAFVLIRVSLT